MTVDIDRPTHPASERNFRLLDLRDSVGLLRSSLRGGLAKLLSQLVNLSIRVGFIAVLSRKVGASDFGVFSMAMVFVGLCDIIASSGLAQGAVQTEKLSREQASTLFAFNVAFAVFVGIACYFVAPFVAVFYSEPRIERIIVSLIPIFVLNAAGAVPIALLQRQMRFVELAAIEIASGLAASSLGVALAFLGYGYWALVVAAVALPTGAAVGAWAASGWIPQRPGRLASILPMLKFGVTVMTNSIVSHLAYNTDKVLLGRFWGADALGVYGRASQLCTMSTSIMNQATWPIAFSALSRLQNNPIELKRYFVTYYMLVNSVTAPTSLFFVLFAPDVVDTILGKGWEGAHLIFRLLAPTIFIFGMMNPPGPLMLAAGREKRSLAIGMTLVPICIVAYTIGLPSGPRGVAAAYTCALALWLVPHLAWCFHGTSIRITDAFLAVAPLVGAAMLGGTLAFGAQTGFFISVYPAVRLLFSAAIMGGVYAVTLFAILRHTGRIGEVLALVARKT